MLPKTHIFLGALFSILVWIIFPQIGIVYILLIFLSSFLVDFDHYLCAVRKLKSLSLKKALDYYRKDNLREEREYKRGIYRKGDFHFLHTIEVHVLVLVLGLAWTPFLYVLAGMTFHSLVDLVELIKDDRMYRREFFFFNWLRKRL